MGIHIHIGSPEEENKCKMGAVGNAYLVLYNLVQFLGWSHMLYILLPHLDTALIKGVDRGQLYADIEWSLKIFQTAAVLEVVHAAVGLVKTNPMLAMFQVSSRVFVVWAILGAMPESRLCRGLPLLLIAWIITEMIRYSFYAVGLLGTNLYIITWLRYTLFFALYPIGVSGELWCQCVSLARVAKDRIFTMTMPNSFNMTFNSYYVLIAIMLSYIPLFPQLYFHMIAQRKKVIGGHKKTA